MVVMADFLTDLVQQEIVVGVRDWLDRKFGRKRNIHVVSSEPLSKRARRRTKVKK
jgi:hypothetical protein